MLLLFSFLHNPNYKVVRVEILYVDRLQHCIHPEFLRFFIKLQMLFSIISKNVAEATFVICVLRNGERVYICICYSLRFILIDANIDVSYTF
jgi:hypothetical protein